MIRPGNVRKGIFVALVLALPGCGTTTQPVAFVGTSTTGGKAVTRLDFDVNDNQASAQSNNKDQIQRLKSLINASTLNTTQPDFKFEVTDYTLDPASGLITGEADNKRPDNNPDYKTKVYFDTDWLVRDGNGQATTAYSTAPTVQAKITTDLGEVQRQFGYIDVNSYAYTPPLKIVGGTILATGKVAPRDTFTLAVISQDPQFPARGIIIHLNLLLAISPLNTAVAANTAEAPTHNTVQFKAEVPGDGFTLPDPNNPSGGQVTWSWKHSDGTAPTIADGGSLDPKTGLFTAPIATGGYIITATSITQPDKSVSTPITVQGQNVGIGFRAAGLRPQNNTPSSLAPNPRFGAHR